MTVMQTQNQLQNKINELKTINDHINTALQMKKGGNFDPPQANLTKDEDNQDNRVVASGKTG